MYALNTILLALWPLVVTAAYTSTTTTIGHKSLSSDPIFSKSLTVDHTEATPLPSSYLPVTTITTGTTFTISTITSRPKATGSAQAGTLSLTVAL